MGARGLIVWEEGPLCFRGPRRRRVVACLLCVCVVVVSVGRPRRGVGPSLNKQYAYIRLLGAPALLPLLPLQVGVE